MRSEGGGSPIACRVRPAVRATVLGAVLAGAVWLCDAPPVAADYTGPDDGARVAVVGDSQVAIATFGGHMVPAHNDRGLQVDSRGHVGRTIAQGRAEIDRVIASGPDVMVVAFGTNDAYFLGASSGPTADRNHAAAREQIEQVMTQISRRPCAIWVTPRRSVTNRAHSRWAATMTDDIKAAGASPPGAGGRLGGDLCWATRVVHRRRGALHQRRKPRIRRRRGHRGGPVHGGHHGVAPHLVLRCGPGPHRVPPGRALASRRMAAGEVCVSIVQGGRTDRVRVPVSEPSSAG